MSFWYINDLVDIVKHGIPYSLDDFKIESTPGADVGTSSLFVRGKVSLPLSKLSGLAIQASHPSHVMYEMCHPSIRNYVNSVNVNFSSDSTISKFNLEADFCLCIQIDRIGKIAREIKDIQFYSAFEKALDSTQT